MARRTRGSQRQSEIRHPRERIGHEFHVWIFDRVSGKRISVKSHKDQGIAWQRANDFLANPPRGRRGDEFHITDEYSWKPEHMEDR